MMLSSETSSAPLKPQRSKSASSINYRATVASEASTADSQNVHRDALTAANLAYERANRYHTVQNGAARSVVEQHPSKDAGSQPTLERRQSVRFVGPNAVPLRTRSITRREVPGYHESQESHELNRHSLPTRPTDLPPYLNELSVTALPEEFNENYVASEPSSYRKLRKAKSMFSPRKAPSTVFANRTPVARTYFQRHSVQSSSSTDEPIRRTDPRLKRSFSFLRGVTDRMSVSNQHYDTHDAAIQLARDTYLRELEQQRLKEQPSFFGLGKRQKPQKAFRRTVRTSSTNSYGTAISSPLSAANPERPKGIGSKARTLSQSWKEKIKRAFKRSSDEDGLIPAQHLDASQPHYGGAMSSSQGSGQMFPPVPEPNAELLRRVDSRESSLRSEPVYVSKNSRPGSIRSVSSDEEATHDKSRVTSWTNSTAANTIKMPSFIDRKRLSIIREDGGPHQPSSSSAQRCDNLSDGYATFRQPIIPGGMGRVETKRIFSALRRQIDENNRRAVSEDGESGSDRGLDQQSKRHSPEIPGRRSSDRSSVRRIISPPEPQLRYIEMRSSPAGTFNRLVNSYDGRQEASLDDVRDRSHNGYAELGEDITPQQFADMNETSPQLPKGPLREVKSAFFPPSMRIERSNTSPYRRAMYASNEDEDAATRWKLNDQNATSNDRHCSTSLAGSESVYSGSSGGLDVQSRSNSTPFAKSNAIDETGTAVILPRFTTPHEPSPKPFFPQRQSSMQSNGDWKNSIATQFRSTESFVESQDSGLGGIAIDARHHKRERAQIDDDDVKIGSIQAPSPLPKQPFGSLHGGIIGQPYPNTERVLSMSNRVAVPRAASDQNENGSTASPPLLSRGLFNKENANVTTGLRSKTPNSLHQTGSHASLTPQNDTKRETATNSPRCSPKRAERLRRLKSSSGTTLGRMSPRNENQNLLDQHFTNEQQRHDSGDSRGKENLTPIQAGMNTKLVNSFLRDRRRDMHISEESGNDPAFL